MRGWYVDKRVNIILHPTLTAVPMALGFNPLEKIVDHLAPHGVCDEDGFFPGEAVRYFDVGFEAGEVLVTDLEIRVGKAPVVRGGIGGGWVIANTSEVFDDLVPNPVPSNEEISRIKALGSSQLNSRWVESCVFIQHHVLLNFYEL